MHGQRQRQRLLATATFHFIPFFFAWGFRFGFLGLLNGCGGRAKFDAKRQTELKCDNDSVSQSVIQSVRCGNERYKCIFGWVSLCLGSCSFACCMSHVCRIPAHSFHTYLSMPPCVSQHSMQSHLVLCVSAVSVSPN